MKLFPLIALLLGVAAATLAEERELSPVERAKRVLDAEAASGRATATGTYVDRPRPGAMPSVPAAPVRPVTKQPLPPL